MREWMSETWDGIAQAVSPWYSAGVNWLNCKVFGDCMPTFAEWVGVIL